MGAASPSRRAWRPAHEGRVQGHLVACSTPTPGWGARDSGLRLGRHPRSSSPSQATTASPSGRKWTGGASSDDVPREHGARARQVLSRAVGTGSCPGRADRRGHAGRGDAGQGRAAERWLSARPVAGDAERQQQQSEERAAPCLPAHRTPSAAHVAAQAAAASTTTMTRRGVDPARPPQASTRRDRVRPRLSIDRRHHRRARATRASASAA